MSILVNNKGQPCICQGSDGLLVRCGGECSCWPVQAPPYLPAKPGEDTVPKEFRVEFRGIHFDRRHWFSWRFNTGFHFWYEWHGIDESKVNTTHCLAFRPNGTQWDPDNLPSWVKKLDGYGEYVEDFQGEIRRMPFDIWIGCRQEPFDYLGTSVTHSPFWLYLFFIFRDSGNVHIPYESGGNSYDAHTASYWNISTEWLPNKWIDKNDVTASDGYGGWPWTENPYYDGMYGGEGRILGCPDLLKTKLCAANVGPDVPEYFRIEFIGAGGCTNKNWDCSPFPPGEDRCTDIGRIDLPHVVYLKPIAPNSCTFTSPGFVGRTYQYSSSLSGGLKPFFEWSIEKRRIKINLVVYRVRVGFEFKNWYLLGFRALPYYGENSGYYVDSDGKRNSPGETKQDNGRDLYQFVEYNGWPTREVDQHRTSDLNIGTHEFDTTPSDPYARCYDANTEFVANYWKIDRVVVEPIQKIGSIFCEDGTVALIVKLVARLNQTFIECQELFPHWERWDFPDINADYYLSFIERINHPGTWEATYTRVAKRRLFDNASDCFTGQSVIEEELFDVVWKIVITEDTLTVNATVYDSQMAILKVLFSGTVNRQDLNCSWDRQIDNEVYLGGYVYIKADTSGALSSPIPEEKDAVDEEEFGRRKGICEDCAVSRCLENDTLACTKIDARRPCKLTEQQRFGECPEGKW